MKMTLFTAALVLLTACQPVMNRVAGITESQPAAIPAAALTGPDMVVILPALESQAVTYRVAVNGDVETWLSVDNIAVSFQQGVLVGSRGFAFDLMGANAQATLEALDGFGDEVYRRQMRYLSGDHKSKYLTAGCSMKPAGVDSPDGVALQRFEETCQAKNWRFTNMFWRDASGRMIRSKQWVSPEIGYLITYLRLK